MSENPDGKPPRDDEPATPVEPADPDAGSGSIEPPVAPDPVPGPDAPPEPPSAPPVAPSPAPPVAPPSYGQPPAGTPAAPAYGQPPAGSSPYGQPAAQPPYGQPPTGAPPYGQPPAGAPPYGQPPAGGYLPPSYAEPGAYPPPVGGGYGPPAQPSPIGESFSYGWSKFTQFGGLFIGAALVWLVGAAVVLGVVTLIFGGIGALVDPDGRGVRPGVGIAASLGLAVVAAASFLVAYLVQAAFIRAALDVTEGRQLSFGDFFKFPDAGPVLLTALLLTGINVVLNLVPVFGQLLSFVASFLLLFTFWFVIDKHLSPTDAIQASYRLIVANLSTTILFYLLSVVVLFAGAILCGVGLLVAVPVVLLATAFLYKRLLGDPIAA